MVRLPGSNGGRPPGATPRAFEHAQRVYAAMLARSVPAVEVGDPEVPAEASAIYVGDLLSLMRELGAIRARSSTQQYHQTKHELVEMGCISQLRRGTRYRLSAWALIRPPTVEAWHEACLRPFSRKREAQLRDGHHRALKAFLRTVAHEHPQLIGLIFADKGVAACAWPTC
jgi:hypothetical protein